MNEIDGKSMWPFASSRTELVLILSLHMHSFLVVWLHCIAFRRQKGFSFLEMHHGNRNRVSFSQSSNIFMGNEKFSCIAGQVKHLRP